MYLNMSMFGESRCRLTQTPAAASCCSLHWCFTRRRSFAFADLNLLIVNMRQSLA
jgi:hypothetical protein